MKYKQPKSACCLIVCLPSDRKLQTRCKDFNLLIKVLSQWGEQDKLRHDTPLSGLEGSDWLKQRWREPCACLSGLTFLQSLDLFLCKAGPVPLQLPLELQPQLRLLALVPLHRDSSSSSARSSSPCFTSHAALCVQQTALRHCQQERDNNFCNFWELILQNLLL